MNIHILNGDALRTQFPPRLSGELIVMRECLVDGAPQGASLEDLYHNRISFLQQAYGTTPEEYRQKTIPEIDKIKNIPTEAEVNLWFENDLFCQVNLWFTAYVLVHYTSIKQIRLIRPTTDLKYGFGGMDQDALATAYSKGQLISREALKQLAQLWTHYQQKDHTAMALIAEQYQSQFPFLAAAIAADRDRHPDGQKPGRPQRTLLALIQEMGSDQFGPVFRAFNERESIYGYGDLQVKRLFDACVNEI